MKHRHRPPTAGLRRSLRKSLHAVLDRQINATIDELVQDAQAGRAFRLHIQSFVPGKDARLQAEADALVEEATRGPAPTPRADVAQEG